MRLLVVGVTDALSMPSCQSIVPSIVQHDRRPWCTGFALAYAVVVLLAAFNP